MSDTDREEAIREAGHFETIKQLRRDLDKAVARLRRTEQALRHIQAIQPETLERLRADGVVFNERPGYDPSNWQQVAFWIYTELCSVETLARAALNDHDTR